MAFLPRRALEKGVRGKAKSAREALTDRISSEKNVRVLETSEILGGFDTGPMDRVHCLRDLPDIPGHSSPGPLVCDTPGQRFRDRHRVCGGGLYPDACDSILLAQTVLEKRFRLHCRSGDKQQPGRLRTSLQYIFRRRPN